MNRMSSQFICRRPWESVATSETGERLSDGCGDITQQKTTDDDDGNVTLLFEGNARSCSLTSRHSSKVEVTDVFCWPTRSQSEHTGTHSVHCHTGTHTGAHSTVKLSCVVYICAISRSHC